LDAAGEFGLEGWLSDILMFIDAVGITGEFHVVGVSLAVCQADKRLDRSLSITERGSPLNFEGVEPNSILELFHELDVAGSSRRCSRITPPVPMPRQI
jgi:hypothetical protein